VIRTPLANIRRAACPASPAILRYDEDQIEDRTERVIPDPTPWDGMTHLDLELIECKAAKEFKR
jgi:hypothetical protein